MAIEKILNNILQNQKKKVDWPSVDGEAVEKAYTEIQAKIAEIVKLCPHFGDWDWCNVNCPLHLDKFCDQVYSSQKAIE